MPSAQIASPLVTLPQGGAGPAAFSLPTLQLTSHWPTTLLVLVVTVLATEQIVYRHRKRHLPGDTWTIPIIGRFLDSLNPEMENYKRGWRFPLSAVSVFHIFIVMASSNQYTRRILNSPTYAEPCLTNSAKQILLPDNWVFLGGKAHVEFRKGLNVLFTRRALSFYLVIQDRIMRRHFARWLAHPDKDARAMQLAFRDLNMETSLRVFCGDYITDAGKREIGEQYWLISIAMELVNFPLALPGTKVYRAIQARKLAMKWFIHACAESKKRMAAGGEPECLVDRWVRDMQNSRAFEAGELSLDAEDGTKPVLIRDFSDREMALVVMSFLFASQDAMSSGITFAFQHLADHPDVLRKLRAEQIDVRGGDLDSPLTLEQLDAMPYTRAVVKESLRLKPPVIMVPYRVIKRFPIADGYQVPKGSMVIPSFWNSLHDPQVYPDPDAFVPERWLDGGNAVDSDPKHYLVYGAGPHRCIGYEYANMQIAAVIGTASLLLDWDHHVTPDSNEYSMLPTIFPKDGLLLRVRPRQA